MTAETALDRLRAERIRQGLPPTVTDPEVLAAIAAVIRWGRMSGHDHPGPDATPD